MLGHEETLGLIKRAQEGEESAKERLVEENLPLIRSVVKRFKGRLEYDDLMQLGAMGFLKAVAGFDEAYGVRFSTYAVPMIMGEIKRFLRDDGAVKVSRWAKALAGKIAARIVREREEAPIETTLRLADIVALSYPPATRHKFGHPAKRVFQAVRIEVNGELEGLADAVTELALRLAPEGRMAVITFHCLEDRVVKDAFRELTLSCTCPPDFPVCVCGKVKEAELVNTKPVTASAAELEENPRAESAKLRVIRRLDNTKK